MTKSKYEYQVYEDNKNVILFPRDFINRKYRKDCGRHVHRWASVNGGALICLCGETLVDYFSKNKFIKK